MIQRYSSRTQPVSTLLPDLLGGACGYDRIAGYFNSSILEIAGEAIDGMIGDRPVRIICNSDLSAADVFTARAAQQAMVREWKQSLPEDISPNLRVRLERLYHLLRSGRLQVRVLPDERFGLLHGKAGIITRPDGRSLAFVGSANETLSGWKHNYEIVWTDESSEGVAWVQQEFDALWRDPKAFNLADGVVQDIARVARRTVVLDPERWRKSGQPDAQAAIELPIYRRENGLWAHQKWFIRHAFDLHKTTGARFVLADQVGLGKTLQLALAAKLMLLWGGGNVLALVPKPLLHQWQDELWDLLQLPSAIWTSKGWKDEQGVLHPGNGNGIDGLNRCPRRFGLVSAGLVKHSGEARTLLASMQWECLIVDEAHHARRKNLGRTKQHQKAAPNNLLETLRAIAPQTKSMLLATATPVQLDPIEAYDLLEALNRGNETVLGSTWSPWLNREREGLALVTGEQPPPESLDDRWEWMRDPFPPSSEDRDFAIIRSSLSDPLTSERYGPDVLQSMRKPDRERLRRLSDAFFQKHNPYIRHIVRRTREFLENEIDESTGEPYLPKIEVRLFGEGSSESVALPSTLKDAYDAAEEFCDEVGKRHGFNSGFLETLLLRRVGSTIIAGRLTARRMLGPDGEQGTADDDTAEAEDEPTSSISRLYPLSKNELQKLRLFLARLDRSGDDPKYQAVERILLHGANGTEPWLHLGCIIFSQFLDSADWVAQRLSQRLPDEAVAVYAGGGRSGLYRQGTFTPINRDEIKKGVRGGGLRLVIGTDAASEGLNLQRLGTLINLDLPWNPTRLEQRKGRIQRIGQSRNTVFIYNMRYRGSVEDRVHQLLSSRLAAISGMFGQLPDTLEDVWVAVAQRDEELARQKINEVPRVHPFQLRYDRIANVDWESCSTVLDSQTQLDVLMQSWDGRRM